MVEGEQFDLLSPVADLRLVQILLADLHDDLSGKVARFRQLQDLSAALGARGTMLPGGEIAFAAWTEARTSFIHGNYVATVLLCQGLAEHMLAAQLALGLHGEDLPERISFRDTLERCLARGVITDKDGGDLQRLMLLRNPLSHFRNIDDPSSLSRRVLDSVRSSEGYLSAQAHLSNDASFAIGVAVRLLALPEFRIDR